MTPFAGTYSSGNALNNQSSPISSWDRARDVPGRIAAADQLQADLTQRTVVTMESSAMVAALKAFGARRIAILTPH